MDQKLRMRSPDGGPKSADETPKWTTKVRMRPRNGPQNCGSRKVDCPFSSCYKQFFPPTTPHHTSQEVCGGGVRPVGSPPHHTSEKTKKKKMDPSLTTSTDRSVSSFIHRTTPHLANRLTPGDLSFTWRPTSHLVIHPSPSDRPTLRHRSLPLHWRPVCHLATDLTLGDRSSQQRVTTFHPANPFDQSDPSFTPRTTFHLATHLGLQRATSSPGDPSRLREGSPSLHDLREVSPSLHDQPLASKATRADGPS
jgi:hypothetical protein